MGVQDSAAPESNPTLAIVGSKHTDDEDRIKVPKIEPDGGRGGNSVRQPTVTIAKNLEDSARKASKLKEGRAVREAEEPSPEESKQASVSEQIQGLCEEIFGSDASKNLKELRKFAGVLANGLLALGIGQNVTDFLETSFKESESSVSQESESSVSHDIFKKMLREEWESSRKMAWLAQTDLLRIVAHALPPAVNDMDPLSSIRDLDRESVSTLAQTMVSAITECLCKEIEKIPKCQAEAVASHLANSKFCVEPRLFTMKSVPSRA